MKVGVLTLEIFWVHRNVGTLLQHYSLLKSIEELGHTPYGITRYFRQRPKWEKPISPLKNKLSAFLRLLKEPRKLFEDYAAYKEARYFEYDRPRSFQKFYDEHIPSFKGYYNRKDLLENPPEADCFICGSDQVWTPEGRTEIFLDWAPRKKRIAYSVSRPWAKTTEKWIAEASMELPYFTAVSVREDEGVDIVKRAGRDDAFVAIDPVLLHDANWYNSNLKLRTTKQNYLLLYVLNLTSLDSIPFDSICEYCRRNNLKLKAVASQGAEKVIPKKYQVKADPVVFLNLVKNAACVVTNSFHGCVFSYVFNKPFAAMLQEGYTKAENARFMTLLERCNEVCRIVSKTDAADKFSYLLKTDSSDVQHRIAEWRQNSISFLKTAFNSI